MLVSDSLNHRKHRNDARCHVVEQRLKCDLGILSISSSGSLCFFRSRQEENMKNVFGRRNDINTKSLVSSINQISQKLWRNVRVPSPPRSLAHLIHPTHSENGFQLTQTRLSWLRAWNSRRIYARAQPWVDLCGRFVDRDGLRWLRKNLAWSKLLKASKSELFVINLCQNNILA